jgi:predicted SnoaL-like aldol condensation-catalyzing enzyme
MAAGNNKDVVRRFLEEVLAGGKLDQIDELVAPGYVNRAFGVGLEAFKGMLAGLSAALPDRWFDIRDLVAEGDTVVARYTAEMRDGSGNTISFRGLTFYRLTGSKIVEDDPITTPDLAQELGPLLGSPPA